MKKFIMILAIISLLAYPVMASVDCCPDPDLCPNHEPGQDFGGHVSGMTECAGQDFGDMVSNMAAPNQ